MKVIVIKDRNNSSIVATYTCNDDLEVPRDIKDLVEENDCRISVHPAHYINGPLILKEELKYRLTDY